MNKVVYTDDVTVIGAQNLNEIQDAVIDTVPKSTGGTFDGDITVDKADGTSSTQGWSSVSIGNNKATGTTENSAGDLQIYGRTAYKTEFISPPSSPTANRVITIPDASGMLTLNKATYLTSGSDLNDLKNDGDTGWYGISTGIANSPVTWGSLLVISGGQGVSQIIFKANQIYTRMYTGSPLAWTAWFTYYSNVSLRIGTPWESLDSTKCVLANDIDNYLYACGNIVYFSIRFTMLVNTTGNLAILRLKSAHSAYKPSMYTLGNGGVYYATRTWNGQNGVQIFFNNSFNDIGVGTGAIANQGYIVQGMYFIE